MDDRTWTIVAWFITVLLIPLMILFFKSESRRVADALAAKEKLDVARHSTLADLVAERHDTVITKLNSYCDINRREHDELFTERRLHGDRLSIIETVHRIKGCDSITRS